jgi:2,4-dienoyl-CoA reductase (NADPH2)
VTLLQRKSGKPGGGPGKTTDWIHRAALQMKQVQMMGGVRYERIMPQGLLVSFGDKRQPSRLIECDTLVLYAGQEPLRDLHAPLQATGLTRWRPRCRRTP